MGEVFYGKYSALSPALEIDGESYSGVLVFNTNPDAPDSFPTIVSGELAEDPTGTTSKTVVCARGYQYDSFQVGPLEGGPRQERFPVLMGGNIANTMEAQRVISHANSRAFRGGDSYDRAQIGDVLHWNNKAFLITDVKAFEEAPASVAWQGDDYLPTISYIDADFQSLVLEQPDRSGLNRSARVRIIEDTDADADWFPDAGVFINSSALTRKIFTNPNNSEDDPDYYPDNASFSTSQGEYWISPITGQIRLGSYCEGLTNSSSVDAVYYWEGLQEYDETSGVSYITSDGTGYDNAGDSLSLIGVRTSGDFGFVPFIYSDANGDFSVGSCEWRLKNNPTSIGIFIDWNSNGVIQNIRYRETEGGNLQSVSFTPNASQQGNAFFNIGIIRTGNSFVVRFTPFGGSNSDLATISLDLEANVSGTLGVGAWNDNIVRTLVAADLLRKVDYDAEGTWTREVITSFTGVEYSSDYDVPSSTAVTEVFNLTTDSAMSSSATEARDKYSLSSSTLTIYSESAGDRIRVTNAADTGTPATPGRAPRVDGTTNFSTQDSTTVSENRGHYYDVLTIYDADDEFSAVEGESFDIKRNPVFDPRFPPSIYYDTKNNDETDWQLLASDNYLGKWVSGIVLLKDDVVSSFGSDDVCFKAEGFRFSQAGQFEARQYNDLVKAIECLDDAWIETQPSNDDSFELTGWMSAETYGPSSYACYDCEPQVQGLSLGMSRSFWHYWAEAAGAFPTPHKDHTTGQPGTCILDATGSVSSYTIANNTAWTDCIVPDTCAFGYDSQSITDAPRRIFVWPWTDFASPYVLGSQNRMGTDYIDLLNDPSTQPTVFKFNGVPFNTPEILKRVPDGTTIVSAYLQVRFNGLTRKRWEIDLSDRYRRMATSAIIGTDYRSYTITVNDQVVKDYAGFQVGNYSNTYSMPSLETEASVGFYLAGYRNSSENIFFRFSYDKKLEENPDLTNEQKATLRDNLTGDVNNGDWKSFGSSISTSNIESGKWGLVDIKDALQALVDDARTSEYRNLQLWPSLGVSFTSSESGLSGFLQSLDATTSISHSVIDDWFLSYTYTASGQLVEFDSIEVGNIMFKMRLPSGRIQDISVPLHQPRMIT